jgi:hypothetical protein
MSNRFDLRQRYNKNGGARKKVPINNNNNNKPLDNTTMTVATNSDGLTAEQQKKLEGYSKVNKMMWSQIPIGSHIRYQGIDGKYRSGGFVKGISATGNLMELHNDLNTNSQRYSTWLVNFSNVATIWKKDRSYRPRPVDLQPPIPSSQSMVQPTHMPHLQLPPSVPQPDLLDYSHMSMFGNDTTNMKINMLETNIKKLELTQNTIVENQRAIMDLLVRKFGMSR